MSGRAAAAPLGLGSALLIVSLSAFAGDPAELAPGAPELVAAEQRFATLLDLAAATRRATTRLQAEWTRRPTPIGACDDAARLEIGWRIERFGAAWREAGQAARAQAARVAAIRAAPTAAPLVDSGWAARLDALATRATEDTRAFLEASAWQATWVRPILSACPAVEVSPAPGVEMPEVPVRGERRTGVAVLALGDGWVCPEKVRADDAVVLTGGEACWSASVTCGCTPEPVAPGAVLGPPSAPAGAGE